MRMAVETGSEAPEFDLAVAGGPRVRLSDFRDRRNVLLVFHPFAFTPVCEDEARDLQENLPAFESAETDVLLVSCDSAPAREAWKHALGLTYTLASDFWPHGEAARAYGVFDEKQGAPVRGTFLIDKSGTVVWSLVKESESRRGELASGLTDLAP
jgi:mycoredoxin-dependent peroxiredoxin